MKSDIIILIIPALIIVLTVYLKKRANIPKWIIVSLVVICSYLVIGIYMPALYRLIDLRTSLDNITVVDEEGKPVIGAGVVLSSSYSGIVLAGVSYEEYRREAGYSDNHGNMKINKHIKPLPLVLIPFLLRLYNGTEYFVYKRGFYPYVSHVESYNSAIKIIMKKVTDEKQLIFDLKSKKFSNFKNINNFINIKSAETYAAVYHDLMEDLQSLRIYDNNGVVANDYNYEYERITNALKSGERK